MGPDTAQAVRAALAPCDFVAAAWVFGSIARGDANSASDLDVAVLLSHRGDATERERSVLTTAALAMNAAAPNGRVDLVVLGRAGPILQHRVVREGALVVDRDPPRRIDFVARAIIDYLDWAPTHRIGMEASLRGLERRLGRSAA